MKNSLRLICALVFLSASSLLAQGAENFSSKPRAAVHVGTHNPYKIGSAENPVFAIEYFSFLNTRDQKNDPHSYYDDAFMDTAENILLVGGHPNVCIEYDEDFIEENHFSLRQGHQDDIIDGLQSQKAQMAFNAWRQNAPATELCAYFNDQIVGNNEAAAAIKNKYPSSAFVFQQLDGYAENYNTYQQSSWFEMICPYQGASFYSYKAVTTPGIINSFLFFKNLDRLRSASKNKVHRHFHMIDCDLFGVDEHDHAILERSSDSGSDTTSPAAVVPGAAYYRPISMRERTPDSNFIKEEFNNEGDCTMDPDHLQFGILADD